MMNGKPENSYQKKLNMVTNQQEYINLPHDDAKAYQSYQP